MSRREHAFTGLGRPERRQSIVLVLVLVLTAVFAGRLVWVQTITGPARAEAAQANRSRVEVLQASRGSILAADGTVLATSVERYRVRVDLTLLPQYRAREDGEVVGYGATAAAEQLAPVLDRDAAELGAELVGNPEVSTGRRDHTLATNVTPETWNEIRALNIPGVSSERTPARTYPSGSTAGPIVGWANNAGVGAAGLESALQTRLAGTDGSFTYEVGAAGQVLPNRQSSRTAPVPGCDVTLTIDADLQYQSERTITDTVERYGAEWGAVVVVEVRTGRILALADSRPYDPGTPPTDRLGPDQPPLSPALGAVYEPGSTGKVLTTLAALEEGTVTPTSPIENPYQLTTPNGQTFTDYAEHPDQVLTTTGVLAESANTSTVNIGSTMSDETRFDYMHQMGWGEPTGLGLPGESRGILASPDSWDGRQRYTTMFGQGVSVTLLQNTGVFATIANQGMHQPPQIIDSYTCDGRTEPVEPAEPTQVVSPESSEQMIRMLESVIDEGGTGTSASVEGYRIAGKTGTAQTADGSGGISATTASFVGIAPADAPEIAVGVVVYKPTSGFFGGTIAAPVFHDVAAAALADLGVPPSTEPAQPYPLTPRS